MKLKDTSGYTVIFSLLVVTSLLIYSAAFVLRAVGEWNVANHQRRRAQTTVIAEAGAEDALNRLDELINIDMLDFINYKSTIEPNKITRRVNRVLKSKNTSITFLEWAVQQRNASGTAFIKQLSANGDFSEATYTRNNIALGGGAYSYQISIVSKGDVVVLGNEQWDFPFLYRIESTAILDNTTKEIIFSGDFNVRVQHDNFARFALFTNKQEMPSGTRVWFTDNTNFHGPVHTNDRFNFAMNPSGAFYGTAAQHEQTARFYNNGWSVLLDDDQNGTRDVPTFYSAFDRGMAEVEVESSGTADAMLAQATNETAYSSDGIYVPNDG